jgi:hypothetical protein
VDEQMVARRDGWIVSFATSRWIQMCN